MNVIRSWSLLRQVLLVDALCSGAMGIGFLGFADMLAALLQLPAGLLTQAGIVLVPFAAYVGWLASHPQPRVWLVWTVIAVNLLWVVQSVLLLFAHAAPNALGMVFVIAQAVAVAVFAELEFVGLRRERLRPAHG